MDIILALGAIMSELRTDRTVELIIGDKKRFFNIDDPALPDWVESNKLSSGKFPYDKRLKQEDFDHNLEILQIELVKLQAWMQAKGERILCLFEGRDAAGKGGTISAVSSNMNARYTRVVALSKPTEQEMGQWYFQRYISHLPSAGAMVLFDRSWYNRAGVEPVMGFCTPEQHKRFLNDAPDFEKLLVRDGIHLFKFWLNIGRETQIERFHDRRHSPLKYWKLSDMDIAALGRWDDYTKVRNQMLTKTDTDETPWTVVRANDKRRTRLNVIRHILSSLDYEGKNKEAIGSIDKKLVISGEELIKATS
jgi:polyphosphate kinase 2